MLETILNQGNDNPLLTTRKLLELFSNYSAAILQALDENVKMKAEIEKLEAENAALADSIEQWKSNDEWANRVTYDNVVDQIASLEDPSKRDDARRVFEPLLKRGQVAQLRKDIKKRAKELNEESDAYSDEQVATALEACAGKGMVIDAKWKWAAVYWYLRWTCNYPVDAKEFCQKIRSLDMDIAAEYECSYESIRKICTLSFMNYDPRYMDVVRVSKNDQSMFSQCREIVLKLADELAKTGLPQ